MLHMPVIEEEGGRLNAFAKEPKMQLIDQKAGNNRSSWLMIIAGGVLIAGLIAFTMTLS